MNFEKVHRKNRKAISPVLATVILIAITLIAAVAIATFVFGIFGTSASPATLSINPSSLNCNNSGAAAAVGAVTAVPSHDCIVLVGNTGTAGGSINGAGPSSGAVVFSLDGCAPGGGGAYGAAASCSIPSNGNAYAVVHLSAYTSGTTVTAFVTQGNGPQLTFTLVLP